MEPMDVIFVVLGDVIVEHQFHLQTKKKCEYTRAENRFYRYHV